MGKLVFWLAVIGALFLAARAMKLIERRRDADHAAGAIEKPATMARCAHCGVHFPADEGLVAHGQVYCSRAHMAAAE